MDCDFLIRSYVGPRDARVLKEACTLTGRPCIYLDDANNPHVWRNCNRRLFALNYTAKYPPEPAVKL